MDTFSSSRDLAPPAPIPRAERAERHRPAPWAGTLALLRGRRGLLILAVALAAAGLLAGWAWLGAAAVLPLVYALPCAAMMAMCMRGHGGSGGDPAAGKPDTASGVSRTGSPQ